MKRRDVAWSHESRIDLLQIQQFITDAGNPANAHRFVSRIVGFGNGLEYGSERGACRDDIRLGLRVVGFERRVTVAFSVEEDAVLILRVFYGGVDWEGAL